MKNHKRFKVLYLVSFICLLILGCTLYLTGINTPLFSHRASINLQQIVVLCVIGGIPGVLYWSKKKVTTLKTFESDEEKIKAYGKIVLARLMVFDFLGILTFFVCVSTDLKGSIMLYGIILLLFMFIWPTEGRFIQETEINPEKIGGQKVEEKPAEEEPEKALSKNEDNAGNEMEGSE